MKKKITINPKFDVEKLVVLSDAKLKEVHGGGTFPGGTLPTIPKDTVGCDRLTGCGTMSGW